MSRVRLGSGVPRWLYDWIATETSLVPSQTQHNYIFDPTVACHMRHNSITKLMFCAVLGMVQPSIMDDVPTFFAAFCSISGRRVALLSNYNVSKGLHWHAVTDCALEKTERDVAGRLHRGKVTRNQHTANNNAWEKVQEEGRLFPGGYTRFRPDCSRSVHM